MAAIRHLDDPSRHPAPDPLDHCAVGLSWYRDGKTVAYALNGFRRGDFVHQADPFAVTIGGNRLSRDGGIIDWKSDTPAVDGKRRIAASFRFRPAAAYRAARDGPGHAGIAARLDPGGGGLPGRGAGRDRRTSRSISRGGGITTTTPGRRRFPAP